MDTFERKEIMSISMSDNVILEYYGMLRDRPFDIGAGVIY